MNHKHIPHNDSIKKRRREITPSLVVAVVVGSGANN